MRCLWGGVDHAGFALCLQDHQMCPRDAPSGASWGATEPCVPSRCQSRQGPAWLLVTVVQPSIARSALSPCAAAMHSQTGIGLLFHGQDGSPQPHVPAGGVEALSVTGRVV